MGDESPATLLHEVVTGGARRHGARIALVHDGLRRSFGELADRVRRAAVVVAGLAAPGGRVAVIGPNHPGWIDLHHGVPAGHHLVQQGGGALVTHGGQLQLLPSGGSKFT